MVPTARTASLIVNGAMQCEEFRKKKQGNTRHWNNTLRVQGGCPLRIQPALLYTAVFRNASRAASAMYLGTGLSHPKVFNHVSRVIFSDCISRDAFKAERTSRTSHHPGKSKETRDSCEHPWCAFHSRGFQPVTWRRLFLLPSNLIRHRVYPPASGATVLRRVGVP